MPILVEQFSQKLAESAERNDSLEVTLRRAQQENRELRAENGVLKAKLAEHESAQKVRQSSDNMGRNAAMNPFGTFSNPTTNNQATTLESKPPEFN